MSEELGTKIREAFNNPYDNVPPEDPKTWRVDRADWRVEVDLGIAGYGHTSFVNNKTGQRIDLSFVSRAVRLSSEVGKAATVSIDFVGLPVDCHIEGIAAPKS